MGLLDRFLKGSAKDAAQGVGAVRPAASVPSSANRGFKDDAALRSWGPVMPAEENQYNYPGSYLDYFTGIFETEFSFYQIERVIGSGVRPVTVFTFWNDGKEALVVELVSERSDVHRQRNICARRGIPYLRFYYDHDGWWNTRSYVVGRVKDALEG